MSGPKRNEDQLNTIGIVVIGICGAVLVYVTIVALTAFYVNDTSELQTMADYGGQDTVSKSLRTAQVSSISAYAPNPRPAAPKANEAQMPQTYRVPIELAMKLVVGAAKAAPAALVPTIGRSDRATVLPPSAAATAPVPAATAPVPAATAPAPGVEPPSPVAPVPAPPAKGDGN
jgi:hypothetical protein